MCIFNNSYNKLAVWFCQTPKISKGITKYISQTLKKYILYENKNY